MNNDEKSDEKQRKFKDFSNVSILWHFWGVSRQLEAAWRRLWAVQRRLGGVLGGLRGVLEASWRVLEASWRCLGASWGHLGRVLGKMSKKGWVPYTFGRGFESQNGGKNPWEFEHHLCQLKVKMLHFRSQKAIKMCSNILENQVRSNSGHVFGQQATRFRLPWRARGTQCHSRMCPP